MNMKLLFNLASQYQSVKTLFFGSNQTKAKKKT